MFKSNSTINFYSGMETETVTTIRIYKAKNSNYVESIQLFNKDDIFIGYIRVPGKLNNLIEDFENRCKVPEGKVIKQKGNKITIQFRMRNKTEYEKVYGVVI